MLKKMISFWRPIVIVLVFIGTSLVYCSVTQISCNNNVTRYETCRFQNTLWGIIPLEEPVYMKVLYVKVWESANHRGYYQLEFNGITKSGERPSYQVPDRTLLDPSEAKLLYMEFDQYLHNPQETYFEYKETLSPTRVVFSFFVLMCTLAIFYGESLSIYIRCRLNPGP